MIEVRRDAPTDGVSRGAPIDRIRRSEPADRVRRGVPTDWVQKYISNPTPGPWYIVVPIALCSQKLVVDKYRKCSNKRRGAYLILGLGGGAFFGTF